MKISHALVMIVLVPLAIAQTQPSSRTATGGKAAPVGGYIRFGNAQGVPPSISFSGDLAGTSASQEVVGILNHPLPPLTSGYLHWNGTTWVFDTPSGGGGTGGGAITVNGGATTYPLNFNDGFPPPPLYGLNIVWKYANGQLSAAVVGDGEPTHCFLGNGQFAPCPSSTTGGGGGGASMTWPATAGIAVYSGSSSWGTSYNATTPIPSSYIPTLNQNTTGNAGTATALAATPTLCSTGQAPTGILPNGNATGCAATSGGGSGTVSSGTAQQVAYYAATGTTVKGDANLTDNSSTLAYIGAGGITAPVFTSSGSQPFSITTLDQGSTPTAPAAGNTLNYSKGGAWCSLSPGGVEKCVGTGGGGGGTTRTWSFSYQGVCQGAVASAAVNFPLTNSPSYVPCTATNITPEWQIPAGNTADTFWVRLKVPAGHTGAYTLTTTYRSAATSGSLTLQPTVACVAPGQVPDNPTFSPSGISTITLTPAATTLQNVTTSGTFTPTCADGADLYVMYTFTINTLASPMNFSYVALAVTGNI